MKNCAIIVNGYYTNKSINHQVEALSFEFDCRGVKVDVLKTDRVLVYIDAGKVVSNIGKYDFIIFLDKDYTISHLLEKCGYRLINSANAIDLCDDKIKTALVLSNNGIPLPMTIASPLKYVEGSDNFCFEVEKVLEYPIVVKEVFGSMGKSVYLAKNRDELFQLRAKLYNKPHFYQRFVGRGGEDIRVITIGNKVVAAMKRSNSDDFRSNIELGGNGEKYQLNSIETEIAEKCSTILGLDYAGIDILIDGDNRYLCEVNSNAFFYKISEVSGVNIAACYAEYVVKLIFG